MSLTYETWVAEWQAVQALEQVLADLRRRIPLLEAERSRRKSEWIRAQADEPGLALRWEQARNAAAELPARRRQRAEAEARCGELERRVSRLAEQRVALEKELATARGLVRRRAERRLARVLEEEENLPAEREAARARLETLSREVDDLGAQSLRATDLAAELKGLREGLEKAKARLGALDLELPRLRAELAAIEPDLAARRPKVQAIFDSLWMTLLPGVPALLFPVRLETRFQLQTDELLVRVYPDDVHQDTHEPELTRDEESWARAFWSGIWELGPDRPGLDSTAQLQRREEQRFARWQVLAGRFGGARAAYLVQVLAPTNLAGWRTGTLPPSPPDFPVSPGRRSGSWTRPARAAAMPDRWLVLGYVGGQRVLEAWGGLIPRSLATGPHPGWSPTPGNPAGQVDPAMRWMVDFAEAERMGMGIRVSLPAVARDGLDRLIVVGLRATASPVDGARDVEALLAAHRHRGELDWVPQGTPTNNTREERSGYASRDADHRSIYETTVRRRWGAATVGGPSEAQIVARRLGLSDHCLADLASEPRAEQALAEAMQEALWPATWGYYLREGFAAALDRAGVDLESWRRHFTRYVRARGPFPILRVGSQPYGLLPVTSLEAWRPDQAGSAGRPAGVQLAGGLAALVNLLIRLRVRWLAAADRVPRAGVAGDVDQQLLSALAQTPVGEAVAARAALGPRVLERAYQVSQPALPPDWETATRTVLEDLLRDLGLDELASSAPEERARWTTLRFTPVEIELSEPWVQAAGAGDGVALATNAPGGGNFLEWLARVSPGEMQAEIFAGAITPSLLFRLLRHSVLQEYSDLARRRLTGSGLPQVTGSGGGPPEEPEWVDPPEIFERQVIPARYKTLTGWRLLSERLAGLPECLGDSLHREIHGGSGAADLDPLRNTLRAVKHLAHAKVADLEWLVRETLDLANCRLDAWITSVATRRLDELRQAGRVAGTYLGGYGWVENLRPRTGQAPSEGFIHAPSLDHAVTAAILRSGYRAHRGDGTAGQLAIDLTSRRVRDALRILDGIRAGHALGALLGQDFERGLLEGFPGLELGAYLDVFRGLSPLATGKAAAPGAAVPAARSGTTPREGCVVDGLWLLRRFQRGRTEQRWEPDTLDWRSLFSLASPPPDGFPNPFPTTSPPGAGEPEYNAVVRLLAGLEDQLDAVSDLLTSEGVFQLVHGNYLRAAASLDALSRGEAPPAEFEVVRTPRTGQTITHRVGLLLDADPDPTRSAVASWPAGEWRGSPDSGSARAEAEPRLNAWLARVLPPPKTVVAWVHPTADPSALAVVHLVDLGVSPLDTLTWTADGPRSPSTELAQRILAAARWQGAPVGSEGARWVVRLDRRPDSPPDETSFEEFLDLVRVIRACLVEARPLGPEDFRGLGLSGDSLDVKELEARADRASKTFASLASEWAVKPGELRPEELERLAWRLLEFDVPVALNVVESGLGGTKEVDAADLEAVAARIREVQGRLRSLESAVPRPAGTIAEQVAHHGLRLGILFGRAMPVLPVLQGEAVERFLKPMLGDWNSSSPDRASLEAWLHRIAPARASVQAFETAMLCAEWGGGQEALNLRMAQWIPGEGASVWLGGEFPPSSRVGGGAHWVMQASLGESAVRGCGLLVDTWAEVIPAPAETTGIAFHWEAPQSTAPQAVLVAVPPDPAKGWEVSTLEAVLLETLDLARLRLVDLEREGTLGHFLPALLLARNLGDGGRGDTIASRFDSEPPTQA